MIFWRFMTDFSILWFLWQVGGLISTRSVISTRTNVIRIRTSVISTRTRLISTLKLRLYTQNFVSTHTRVISTRMRVNMTLTSVIYTRTRFLHVEYNLVVFHFFQKFNFLVSVNIGKKRVIFFTVLSFVCFDLGCKKFGN
jgi:hypothetical protein